MRVQQVHSSQKNANNIWFSDIKDDSQMICVSNPSISLGSIENSKIEINFY
jgi:hypothetical protein